MLEQFSKAFPMENMAGGSMQREKYFSVEIRPDILVPVYKFRLRKSLSNGSYILVKDGSAILKYLKSGQKLNINYNPAKSTELSHTLKTKINYIIQKLQGRFKGHYMVGLSTILNL